MHKVSVGEYPFLKEVLDEIGGISAFIKPNETVFIKPNICAPKKCQSGAVTSPELIEKLILLLKEITSSIQIGDCSFSEFKGLAAIRASGIYDIAKKHNVEVIDLSSEKKVEKGPFIISKPIIDADKVINVPVLKTHERAGVTISLKNMMGIIPGALKTNFHKSGLENGIIELAKVFKPVLNIVDANICMEGRGPTNGKPKKLGLIIAGDNQVAVDTICCHLMGINPKIISYLRLADKHGIGSMKDIDLTGFKNSYISRFELPLTYKNLLFRTGMQVLESKFRNFIEKNNRIAVNYAKCTKCALCSKTCPTQAMPMGEQGPVVDYNKCIFCLCCFETCMYDAINIERSRDWIFNLVRKIGGFKGVNSEDGAVSPLKK